MNNLIILDEQERNSVIALITLTKAVTRYETLAAKKDKKLVGKYYLQDNILSRTYVAPGKFQSLVGSCFEQSVACLTATNSCLDDGGGWGKKKSVKETQK